MADQEAVKLYGMWSSPFSRRVELALKLKGVPFEYIEEDLSNKSPLLLKYNPIHKKVPVLVHNGKPVVESLVILEYVDEIWKNNPILPQDPYERAMARFWGSFIDDKILVTAKKVHFCLDKEREAVILEVCEQMKMLEKQLNGKDFFGGDKIGFVDIVGNIVAFWFPITQKVLGSDFFTSEKFPGLFKWIGKLQEIDVVNESRPPREKHLAYVRAQFEALKIAPK
uniref:glutathione transferase n=1 Tax=Litchi chinensis TaxID=151069 RepID=A0A0U4K0R2_LITCN|nr:GST7 [Litchi chinensis]